MGRPTTYCEEIAAHLCDRLAEGESLREMCRDDPLLPGRSTINQWADKHPEFADRVARARAQGSHALIEEAREIADTPNRTKRVTTKESDEGIETTVVVLDTVDRDRLRVEQRWREAQSHNPRAYSQKQSIEHSGELHFQLSAKTDDELMADLLELAASGRLKLPGGIQLIEAEDPITVELIEDEDDDIA